MRNVLFKVLVARYYKINTGFFLLLFLLLFALLDGRSTIQLHYGIMQGITNTPAFCLIAMLVWAVYNLKCISFCTKALSDTENGFLFRLQSLPYNKQFQLLLSCQAAIYLPLLLYGIITTTVGIKEHHYLLAALFLCYQLIMCGLAAAVYVNRINSTWKKPVVTVPSPRLSLRRTYMFYLLHYSLDGRKGTFAGIKLFSLLLLQAMVAANSNKLSKEAICVLIMFLISAHSLLPLYYMRFTERALAFSRNLPIPVLRRFMAYTLTYAIIFLPELFFLLLNEHRIMPLQLTLSLYVVAVSQLSLYTALLYIKGMRSERYTGFVFGLFFVNLLLLASFNLWALAVIEAMVSVGLFVLGYERYEVVAGEE